MNRLDATFETLRKANRAAFIPFFCAGDPDIQTTRELVKAAADAGADAIEIGVPFSDPIADGPVIQAAYYRALDKGFRVAQLFELASNLRKDGVKVPLICMVSETLVYKRTLPKFLADLKAAGFDGLIVPDLPAGYEGDAAEQAAGAEIDLIFLAAPTTNSERREVIAKRSRGFVYYISVTGITGARTVLPPDLADNVKDLRSRSKTPVCVGFGISRPEQATAVAKVADGVIIGSALVKKIEEACAAKLSGAQLTAQVTNFVKELAQATHSARQ
jgi:tryptophan synthase alpha chain